MTEGSADLLGQGVARRFLRHRLAVASLALLAVTVFLSLTAGHLIPYRYDERTPDVSQGPSLHHPMGTDELGRDLLSRVFRGAQRSVQVGLLVAAVSTAIGVLVGTAAGYYGGWVDGVVGRLVDFMLIIPVLAVLLVVANGMGGQHGTWPLIALIIALVTWPFTARVVRGAVLSLSESGYVEAARGLGASDLRVIVRHVLPNAAGVISVTAVLAVAGAILLEAGLTFLGLGVTPPDVSLGALVQAGQQASTTRPWLFYFPGLMLVLICLCVNFVGDAVRDALDPRSTYRTGQRRARPAGR